METLGWALRQARSKPAHAWLEWPSPHDCTSSIWDELKFIPIIGYAAGIEVGSFLFIFSLTYFKATHKRNLFDCPSISNPNYLLPPHRKPWTSPPFKSRNDAAKDGVTKAMLKCCYRRQCCKCSVEAMLQKMMLQKRCWSSATEDIAEVVL